MSEPSRMSRGVALLDRSFWLVGLAIWAPLLVKGVRKLVRGDGNDFTIFFAAAGRIIRGEALYDGTYMYPPLFAVLLVPAVLVGHHAAGMIWLFIKVPLFCFAASTFVPAELPEKVRRRLILLSPLLVYRSLDSDLATGNSNVILLAGLALAYRCAARGRDGWAGTWLALVASVKLAPAYLLPAFSMAGRAKTAAIAVVLLPLFLIGPALFLGGLEDAARGFVRTSHSVFSAPEASGAGTGYVPGQSLRAIVHRLLRDIDATAHDAATRSIHLTSVPAGTAELIYGGLAVVLAVLGLWAIRGRSLGWMFAWSLLIVLLASPYTRKAHFVLALPAYLLVVDALRRGCRSRVLIAAATVSVLLAQGSTRFFWGKTGAALLLAYGALGLSAGALLVAMWVIRRLDRGRKTLCSAPESR